MTFRLNGSKMPANPGSRTVLVIVGPTAVGKTDLAIELAQLIDGEIYLQTRVCFIAAWILVLQNQR